MKCPIPNPAGERLDCLREECGIWDKPREQCTMLTVAAYLVLIKDYVRGICEDLAKKQ